MRFDNPDTGEILEIDYTIDLGTALREAAGPECEHQNTEIRIRKISGGGVQVKPQCLTCGLPLGNPKPKADHPNAPPFDENLLDHVQKDEMRRKWNAAVEYQKKYSRRELEFQARYDAYLKSPQWLKLRSLVLKRCSGVCEGCMEFDAREIHHLTYKNFGDEFLFQLFALCESCHRKVHKDSEFETDPWDERICRGCRYQGDGEICPIFNVSEEAALSDDKYCGPRRVAFEPLK